eukprot:maker-scaffold_70-snap-gene-0.115-mRNA-1 protein AED:0.77 eAED:0.86 QI:0/0/0/0.5/0/0/2/0/635
MVGLTRLTLLTYAETANSEVVVDALWRWHSHFILADEFFLVTDQGSHFVNTIVTKFLKESNGLHKMTAAYVSQTAGTVEVQNKSVLKNLRSLVSEFGLKEDQWPRILTLVQGFLNSNPLTCRGYPKKSPFELIYGEEVKLASIGSGNLKLREKDLDLLKLREKDLDLLKQRSVYLPKKIADYQEITYKKGLEYRYIANKRRGKRLTPIQFNLGEYVWLSEKGLGNMQKDKSRPRWSGPYQLTMQISEHLFEVKDLMGNMKIRHTSLLVPFAPSSFLPSPDTTVVFLDKGKLEFDSIVDLRKTTENEFLVSVKWRGFDDDRNTWEAAVIMYEDVPLILLKYLDENKNNNLVKELVQFLKLLYPEAKYRSELNRVFRMGQARETFEDLVHKLLSQRIVDTAEGKMIQYSWSLFEAYTLKVLVAKFGMGNFVEFKKWLPGKSKQQIYNRLQRYLRRQSLEHLHGLKVNLDVVRRNNLKAGKYYLKNKKSLDDKTKCMKRFFNVWRYAEQHIKNNSKNFKVKLVVYDVFSIEGLKQLYSEVSQVIADEGVWDKYPDYNGDLTEFRQQIKWCIKGYSKRLRDVSEGFEELRVIVKNEFEGVEVFVRGYQLKCSKTINMVHAVNQELNVEFYIWKRPRGSR